LIFACKRDCSCGNLSTFGHEAVLFDNDEREFDKLQTGRQAHPQRTAMCVMQVPLSGKTGAFS
jgi:hypothetical protein